jgi:hypothetical protein
MWLGWGDKEYILNFGKESSLEMSTCKTEKEMGGYHRDGSYGIRM